MVVAQKVPEGATAAMIADSWNGQFGWRWMFTLVAAPSLLFFFSSLFVPESPRWLVKNGQDDLRAPGAGSNRGRRLTPLRRLRTSKRPSRRRRLPACGSQICWRRGCLRFC